MNRKKIVLSIKIKKPSQVASVIILSVALFKRTWINDPDANERQTEHTQKLVYCIDVHTDHLYGECVQ